jgi:hypothetical protein
MRSLSFSASAPRLRIAMSSEDHDLEQQPYLEVIHHDDKCASTYMYTLLARQLAAG